jgi:hypothetical protein
MIRAGSGSVIKGKDPRIRIRMNKSRIRNTGFKHVLTAGPVEQLQPWAAALPCCQADWAGPAEDPPQQQTLRVATFLRYIFSFFHILEKVFLHRKIKKDLLEINWRLLSGWHFLTVVLFWNLVFIFIPSSVSTISTKTLYESAVRKFSHHHLLSVADPKQKFRIPFRIRIRPEASFGSGSGFGSGFESGSESWIRI